MDNDASTSSNVDDTSVSGRENSEDMTNDNSALQDEQGDVSAILCTN